MVVFFLLNLCYSLLVLLLMLLGFSPLGCILEWIDFS